MKKFLILSLLIFSLVLGGCGQKTALKPITNSEAANNQGPLVKNVNQNKVVTNTNQPIAGPVATGLVALDAKWNQYTNSELGFSLKVPKQMWHLNGSCELNKAGYYRPKAALVPVEVFIDDDQNNVYLVNSYYYALSGETQTNEEGGLAYAKCNKVASSLLIAQEQYNNEIQGWKMRVEEAQNEAALGAFIKQRYGLGCVGEQKSATQEGVYKVSVKFVESQCPVNYWTEIYYSPTKSKVIAWDLGHDYRFRIDPAGDGVDREMIDSFRFVD